MPLDYALAEIQAEPVPTWAAKDHVTGAKELLEDSPNLAGRYAHTLILH